MKKFGRTGIVAASIGVLLALGVMTAFAEDSKEAKVQARKDFMDSQQKAVNAVNAFAKGTGDRAAAVEGVNKLVEYSKEMEAKFDVLFAPGTSSTDVPDKSKAKPELWQHTAELKLVPAKLREAELKLADVVKTGEPAAVGDAMRDTYRATCNAFCHDSYRVPSQR